MKKIKKFFPFLFITFASLLSLSQPALAGELIELAPPSGSDFGHLGGYSVPQIITAVIRLSLIVASLTSFAFLIYGGIMWITASGDKAKLESAKNTLTAALIGLLITFSAWAIIRLIQIFFRVTILNMTVPQIGEVPAAPPTGTFN